jgi:hypothetical protein
MLDWFNQFLGCPWGIIKDVPLASLYFPEVVILGRWFHWGFVHSTTLSCLCTHVKDDLLTDLSCWSSLCSLGMNHIENTVSNISSVVTEACLPSQCLATALFWLHYSGLFSHQVIVQWSMEYFFVSNSSDRNKITKEDCWNHDRYKTARYTVVEALGKSTCGDPYQ